MPETPDQQPDFPTHFDFAAAEPALTSAWDANGIFRADASRTKAMGGARDPFTVLIASGVKPPSKRKRVES